ncbi:hypothetical protein KPL71_014430 [Citrus sinensis]|uniref:Uncharacterized protein n=1 Tax=Citrus sinensis TaxID=2711 RepID=A0ACB8KBT0_CITSI|nr:hypothetical protein KPL71_014430 [Citrus sinensis]
MVDAIVSSLLEQLISVAADEVKQQVRLVTGVRQEVKKLTSNLQAIRAVLEDAEKRQMQHDKAVTFWLDQLKDASYDMEDVLEEWTTARLKLQIEGVDDDTALALAPHKKKVRSFFCALSNCFGSFKQLSLRHDIAVKIREINGTLDDIASQKDTFKFVENVSNNVKKPERVRTTSLIDEGEVCGRVDEKNELLSKLLCESGEQQQGLYVISLVGLGGIGKTTLAQLAYNNDEVKRNFEKVIWVCVSDTFEGIRVAKAIIEGLGVSASGLSEFESLMKQIQEYIMGKKFFLVLDDVWDGDYKKWDPFFSCLKNGHHESKILITTRDRSVALQLGSIDIIPVKELGEGECCLLFKQIAFLRRSFEDREKLEPMGRKIAHKCKGLPLAAKVIGNLLRSKSTVKEWQRILESEMWKVEEIGQGLLAPLLLSYNDLPSNSMVKRCFSYCAVFPKNYNMNKEELISLWMAQGYLNAEEDEEMEMIGEEYFNILAARSFFQEFKKNDDDDIMSCKMHDIVHDFAQFVSSKECLWLEINGTKESVINSFGDKVRHLGLNFEGGASFPMSIRGLDRFRTIRGLDRLRTLLIYDRSDFNLSLSSSILSSFSISKECLRALVIRQLRLFFRPNTYKIRETRKLFSKLACLRALVIRQSLVIRLSSSPFRLHSNLIREIPKNVGKLIHLRYLNLSELGIERLPKTLCELYNLQKLDIRRCRNLKELPAGIGKLKNMRSLLNGETYSLKYMPVGISKLTSLRTLDKFVVGGGIDGSNTCRLESLKNLQLLRECGIEGLGNVSHLDEAERLQLYNQQNLLRLRLEFGRVVDGEDEARRRKKEKDEQLLKTLQPPLSVEKLGIILYGGNIFPKWLTSLTNLRNLYLRSCVKCEHLPPLGKLPLEKLELRNLKSVKRVGNEFLGTEESSEDGPSSSSSSPSVIAFPKLKSLIIGAMEELEEWNYRITRKENISIMPRLSSLEVRSCNKLKALPDYLLQTTTLQDLTIWKCPILENRYREGKGEDWHKISHIPHIKWWPLPIRLAVERLPLWLLCDFEEESDGWALKSYKAKHLWADHMFQLRKEFGVGNIVQVIVVDFDYSVEDIPETKDLAGEETTTSVVIVQECDLQGFEKVLAVKFPPQAIAAKRHIHLRSSVSDFLGVLVQMFLKGPLNYLMKLESCYCLNESTIFCCQGIPHMMRLCDCYWLLNYLLNQVDFEDPMENIGVLKSYRAKHMWSDHMLPWRKEFGIDTIIQVTMVCIVLSLRVCKSLAVKLPARGIAHSSSTILDFQGYLGPLTVFTHVSILVVITISDLASLRCIRFETAFVVKFQCLYNGREEVKDTKQLIMANVRMKIVHHTWHVEYNLQGFQKVFAVKFQPIAVKRHIHLSNSVSDFQGVDLSELSEEDGVSQTKYKKISHIPHVVSTHRWYTSLCAVFIDKMAAKYEIEKFNGNNFSLWKMKMKAVLRKNNCLAAIGERPMEITDDKWNEVDGNAISDLHLALADGVLSSVAEKNTAKEIWDTLTKLYEAKLLRNKIFLKRKLYILRVTPQI